MTVRPSDSSGVAYGFDYGKRQRVIEQAVRNTAAEYQRVWINPARLFIRMWSTQEPPVEEIRDEFARLWKLMV